MRSKTELCLSIAEQAHEGQTDKAGAPYIQHALRVAVRCRSEKQICAALLHDVVEDTPLSADDLIAAGVEEDVVGAVLILTHGKHPSDAEYFDYIRKICDCPIARAVKMADLRDNMNLKRLSSVNDDDLARQKRYEIAYRMLEQAGDRQARGLEAG